MTLPHTTHSFLPMSQIQKFLFDGLPVRGVAVRLTDAWQEVLQRHASNPQNTPYPAPVLHMLGQMAAGAVLMQSNIKFNGALVLQLQGNGPVKMAVAEVQSGLALRATATVIGEVASNATLPELIAGTGSGQCAITLDPQYRLPGQQPYQGVVPLHDADGQPLPDVAQALQHYMRHSEQLDTTLILAANAQVAAGLLIQRLPLHGQANLSGHNLTPDAATQEQAASSYQHISALAHSLQPQELLELDIDTILHRLFWNEKLLRFAPTASDPTPHFACTCSSERVASMLKTLGQEEADSIIAEQGQIEVGCQFCGQQYRFDAVEVAQIFTPTLKQPPVSQQAQ